MEYDAKEGVISIEYPLFYFLNQGKVVQKVEVLEFDHDGNV